MTGERIPVFPIEWLLIENIKSLEKAKLDTESIKVICQTYKQILMDELKARDKFELMIRQSLEQ